MLLVTALIAGLLLANPREQSAGGEAATLTLPERRARCDDGADRTGTDHRRADAAAADGGRPDGRRIVSSPHGGGDHRRRSPPHRRRRSPPARSSPT